MAERDAPCADAHRSGELLSKTTVDPYVAQEMGRQAYDVENVDWSLAAWDRIPALRNLQKLSDLSRLDMSIPPKEGMCELMAGGTIGLAPARGQQAPPPLDVRSATAEANPQGSQDQQVNSRCTDEAVDDSAELPVLHPAAEKLLELSPEGRRVPRAQFMRVNQAVDMKEVETVQDMCVRERVPERLSRGILGMKQLLGLSALTTAHDEQFMDLVGAVADSNSGDKSIVQLMLKSGVKYTATSLSQLSQRRHHATYPNRGFNDSNIVAYPELARREEEPPSMHNDGRGTWQQRHLDIGAGCEDPDALEAYQDALTTAEGRLEALEERLDTISHKQSPYRERVLRGQQGAPAASDGSSVAAAGADVADETNDEAEVAATGDSASTQSSTCVSPHPPLVNLMSPIIQLEITSYEPPAAFSQDANPLAASNHRGADEGALSTSGCADPKLIASLL